MHDHPELAALPFDHVAVAVESIELAAAAYESLLGTSCSVIETVASQGVRVAFVGPVELIEPTGPDSSVARFLERRGTGLHHIAFRTADLVGELRRLAEAGVELIDRVPRPGAGGHTVAFLHPRSMDGVLVELVERQDPRRGPSAPGPADR